MDTLPALDYKTAFDLAPVGLILSRNRIIVDCNQRLSEMFEASLEVLQGQSFSVLYPSQDEFERTGAKIAPILNAKGFYSDDRLMKRFSGEVFWCHVSGKALNRHDPHEAGIWSFEDLSPQRTVKADLTAREREVAALLLSGLKTKEIAKLILISPRTVEIYRANLMRKLNAISTADLVHKLMSL